jgi:DNA anti-recombination protein RmuC
LVQPVLAMLSSLQMGFRTLALEQRSSEVWQVLGAVKTEFGKFGDVLSRVKSQTEAALTEAGPGTGRGERCPSGCQLRS